MYNDSKLLAVADEEGYVSIVLTGAELPAEMVDDWSDHKPRAQWLAHQNAVFDIAWCNVGQLPACLLTHLTATLCCAWSERKHAALRQLSPPVAVSLPPLAPLLRALVVCLPPSVPLWPVTHAVLMLCLLLLATGRPTHADGFWGPVHRSLGDGHRGEAGLLQGPQRQRQGCGTHARHPGSLRIGCAALPAGTGVSAGRRVGRQQRGNGVKRGCLAGGCSWCPVLSLAAVGACTQLPAPMHLACACVCAPLASQQRKAPCTAPLTPLPAGARDGALMVWDARVAAQPDGNGASFHCPVVTIQQAHALSEKQRRRRTPLQGRTRPSVTALEFLPGPGSQMATGGGWDRQSAIRACGRLCCLFSCWLPAGCLILLPWLGACASSRCLFVRLPACSNPGSPACLAACDWQCLSLPLSMCVPYTAQTPTDLIPATPLTPTHPPAAPQVLTA